MWVPSLFFIHVSLLCFWLFYLFSISIFNHLKFKTSRCPFGFFVVFSFFFYCTNERQSFCSWCNLRYPMLCVCCVVIVVSFYHHNRLQLNIFSPTFLLSLAHTSAPHFNLFIIRLRCLSRSPRPTIPTKKWRTFCSASNYVIWHEPSKLLLAIPTTGKKYGPVNYYYNY